MTGTSQIDYLLTERVLSETEQPGKLNPVEADFCRQYKPVFDVGRLAGRMARGYYAHKAAIDIAKDPRADSLIPPATQPGHVIPVGDVHRKGGKGHVYDIRHYLGHARTDPDMAYDLDRIWLLGSLIVVGDALADLKYLNHAPVLELLYHLRNGAAHGNTFTFTVGKRKPGLDR